MARPCVLDASLLTALGKAGQLDLLRKTRAYEWRIAPIARGELKKPETRHPVEQMILDGVIRCVELDSDQSDALALFAQWSERVDPGEAESIAIALANGWLVGLEDIAPQRLIDREAGPGHWINCANILIDAVQSGSLSLAKADEIFRSLDVYPGYASRGIRSLAQLM